MLGLPEGTAYGKRVPKQKFYENLKISPALKKNIQEQIHGIYWQNKIAPSTVNIAVGQDVTEIEVMEIVLNGSVLDESVLKQIDREIPYHILFVLTRNTPSGEKRQQAWIGYKEAAESGTNAFKVSAYYHTEWLPENELSLQMDGLTMDAVYENYVRQIAGEQISSAGQEEALSDAVDRSEQKKLLEKQIATLKNKLRREKQLDRQMEINAAITEFRHKLEDL